jgi:glycerate kinase
VVQVPPAPILSQGTTPTRAVRSTGGAGSALRVLLAPNAFKGSLLAADVARAMAEGVARVAPAADVVSVPIADGGDGSVDAFVAAGYVRVPVVVRGPTGTPGDSSLAQRGRHAVVELASSCGMTLLPGGVPAPMTATTEGLGDAVRAALDAGVDELLVCLGGSASTDGGTGLLSALGAVLLGAHGDVVPPGGAGLADITRLDLSGLDPRLSRLTVTLAVDVSSPLYGPTGAAAVFAPQKGASDEQVACWPRRPART